MPDQPQARAAAPNLKRKHHDFPAQSGRKKQRTRAQDARIISTQTSGQAFKDGQIDVDKFVRVREFEIKALEDGMKRAKKSLSSRAFQNVPRDLRRRTASHNAKRVPKRLRARAEREMLEDNTPTVSSKTRKPTPHKRLRQDTIRRLQKLGAGRKRLDKKPEQASDETPLGEKERSIDAAGSSAIKPRAPRIKTNKLSNPAVPPAKFRKRQIHKAWLPTHVFHAKRAHMTPPSQPLWRMAIPLSPTTKSYRTTHRASSARGAVAWDMSYMSTILLEGQEESIRSLLVDMSVGRSEGADFWEVSGRKWLSGSRFWEGWVFDKDGWPTQGIAPVTIMWQPGAIEPRTGKSKLRQAFVRVHPSAFFDLWKKMLALAKAKSPAVTLQDLRFEIGSIEVIGPASTEALLGVLHPISSPSQPQEDTLTNITTSTKLLPFLGPVTNPSTLPQNVILPLELQDPRLSSRTNLVTPPEQEQDQQDLLQILGNWPLDIVPTPSSLFDRSSRLAACRQMPSAKAINRRRTLAGPGNQLEPRPTDPQIPALLFASRGVGGLQGKWTLMLPWKYILPFWYSLMYQPISTGGTIRFGGLTEKRQIDFEAGVPWFPADYPGTKAGFEWEEREKVKRKQDWEKRPKGKRVAWESLNLGGGSRGEIGVGWACDWDFLFREDKTTDGEVQIGHHITKPVAAQIVKDAANSDSKIMRLGLATVKIVMLAGGVPTTCARIYRLPTSDQNLFQQWLAQMPGKRPKSKHGPQQERAKTLPKEAPEHVRRQHLAASLLAAADEVERVKTHPRVPGADDLIGFVTTGNFNLGQGRGTGTGSISLRMACEGYVSGALRRPELQLCIVRNAGQVTGRLAKWELA